MTTVVKEKLHRLLLLLLLIFSLSTTVVPASHAVEKAGAKCTAAGKTVVQGKTKLTCTRVTEYKWVATPIRSALGTKENPVIPGSKFKINTLQFQAGAVDFNFGDELCRENAFNEGCVFNRGFPSSVDPESPNRWIGVDLIVTNLTKKNIGAVDLNYSYYMILPTGRYVESARGVIYTNAPVDISLPPSTPTTMRVAFALSKAIENLNPIIVVSDDSGAKAKEYFFYLNW